VYFGFLQITARKHLVKELPLRCYGHFINDFLGQMK